MKSIQTAALSPLRNVRLYRFCMRVGSLLPTVGLLIFLVPKFVWACACGCSIFDVGTPSLIPNGSGGQVWFEYDFQNQYINWAGSRSSAAENNSDKQIKTHFLTAGGQYMFNRSFGLMVTVPYWARIFRTEGATPDQIDQFGHANFGDVRVWGMYTGLLEDMSLGLLAGFKLPTGDHTYANFDRDTSIGTGSTDLLLGAYKIGNFPERVGNLNLTFLGRPFNYYLQLQYDYPFRSTGNYTPGKEFDGAVGFFYDFGHVGVLNEFAPFLSFYGSVRSHDLGSEANTPNSGYDRLHIGPGGEIGWKSLKLFTDIEFPLYQYTNGNQLVAPYMVKTILSYSF